MIIAVLLHMETFSLVLGIIFLATNPIGFNFSLGALTLGAHNPYTSSIGLRY